MILLTTTLRWMLILLMPVAMALTGCRDDEPGTDPAPAGLLKIAVIPKATNHEFWKAIHAGALKAELELEGVQTIWQGPAREDDRDQQISVVENAISAGVSGIVLAPLDDVALIRPVRDAMRAGIPVVIMDSGLKAEAGTDYVSFVATDNRTGGEKAARELGRLLGGKGRVLVMRYLEGSASTTAREEGFLAELKSQFPDIHVVSSDQYAGATSGEAQDKAENLLSVHRDLDGIFCPCEPPVFGMLLALRDAGRAGKVKLVGFDRSDKLIEGMTAGEIDALVLQDPLNMGYLAVKTLVAHLRGQQVAPRIDTGSVVATPGNMNEARIRELLSPPVEQYLK